jgi:glycosyltransferase involved in cell wall biosynthesis
MCHQMKVAYLIPGIQGGWGSHALGFISAIQKYVTPILLVSNENYATAKEIFPGLQLDVLPSIQGASLRPRQVPDLLASVWRLRHQRHLNVDVVHSLEAYPTGLVGHCLASKLKTPHVITAHGTYGILPYTSLPDRMAYTQVLRRANALCPVSHGTADLISTYFPKAVKDLYVKPILNGNGYYKTIPSDEAICRQPASIPTILSVGDLKRRKGYHISLQAFARLKEMIPSARYWIVGRDRQKKYYHELLQVIARHHLKDVEFFGAVSEERLRQCYRQASVFLLAPQQVKFHFEGFGLVYLEAGAFGVPVVGTRTGGVADAIRHGETGFVVDPHDIEGLASALKRLLTDSVLRQRMGIANRKWAETLTWERYAMEQYQVYQDVLL